MSKPRFEPGSLSFQPLSVFSGFALFQLLLQQFWSFIIVFFFILTIPFLQADDYFGVNGQPNKYQFLRWTLHLSDLWNRQLKYFLLEFQTKTRLSCQLY
jgi:hypothetical protein